MRNTRGNQGRRGEFEERQARGEHKERKQEM